MTGPARLIAFYLPQFHPIPENDAWWGKGFTEWTNTAKAKPLFPGHYQPHLPADLGFYDLRLPQARAAQADLAREYGIEAFCYYHYWFAGRRVIEQPFEDMVRLGEPDFPFCVCWANESWTGVWHGLGDKMLLEQTYPGIDDHRAHFQALLPAFNDRRYLRVHGKPLFMVYKPMQMPGVREFTELWREMACAAGLKGLHLVGVETDNEPNWPPQRHGFDASISPGLRFKRDRAGWERPRKKVAQAVGQALLRGAGIATGYSFAPTAYDYGAIAVKLLKQRAAPIRNYPVLIPNWDNTPRSGRRGLVFHNSAPELFRLQARRAAEIAHGVDREENLIFIKSWNEWAEGNHLEPDLRFGHGYLRVLRDVFGATG